MADGKITRNCAQKVIDQGDTDFWLKQINNDPHYVQFMIDMYKKQQLTEQGNEQGNIMMTHRPRSSSISSSPGTFLHQPERHLSRLMDKPITIPSVIQQQQLINNQVENIKTKQKQT